MIVTNIEKTPNDMANHVLLLTTQHLAFKNYFTHFIKSS